MPCPEAAHPFVQSGRLGFPLSRPRRVPGARDSPMIMRETRPAPFNPPEPPSKQWYKRAGSVTTINKSIALSVLQCNAVSARQACPGSRSPVSRDPPCNDRKGEGFREGCDIRIWIPIVLH